jgi:hypothetical protein
MLHLRQAALRRVPEVLIAARSAQPLEEPLSIRVRSEWGPRWRQLQLAEYCIDLRCGLSICGKLSADGLARTADLTYVVWGGVEPVPMESGDHALLLVLANRLLTTHERTAA